MAWYKPGQWDLLLMVSEDRDQLEDTYMEWMQTIKDKLPIIGKQGIQFERVVVDVPELVEWAKKHNLAINSETRARFVTEKLR